MKHCELCGLACLEEQLHHIDSGELVCTECLAGIRYASHPKEDESGLAAEGQLLASRVCPECGGEMAPVADSVNNPRVCLKCGLSDPPPVESEAQKKEQLIEMLTAIVTAPMALGITALLCVPIIIALDDSNVESSEGLAGFLVICAAGLFFFLARVLSGWLAKGLSGLSRLPVMIAAPPALGITLLVVLPIVSHLKSRRIWVSDVHVVIGIICLSFSLSTVLAIWISKSFLRKHRSEQANDDQAP